MPLFEVLNNLKHDGENILKGSVREFPEGNATENLIKIGVLKPVATPIVAQKIQEKKEVIDTSVKMATGEAQFTCNKCKGVSPITGYEIKKGEKRISEVFKCGLCGKKTTRIFQLDNKEALKRLEAHLNKEGINASKNII